MFPELRRAGQPEHASTEPFTVVRTWFWLLLLMSFVCVSPLFLVRYPASHDFPQHLAAVHMLRVYPEQGLGATYELALMSTQYSGFYALAALLSFAFGELLATKFLIAAIGVSIPLGAFALLGSLGRDPRMAFFTLPLTLSSPLVFGLYNYTAGLGIMLFALSSAARLSRHDSSRRWAVTALLLSLMVLTHPVPIAFALLGAATFLLAPDLRLTFRRLLSLLPLVVLTLLWSLYSKAASAPEDVKALPEDVTFSQQIELAGTWLTCFLKGRGDDRVLLVWIFLALAALATFALTKERSQFSTSKLLPLSALATGSWLCFFFLPHKYAWVYPVAPRFAVLAMLFTLLLLPPLPNPKIRLFCFGLCALVVVQTALVGRAFLRVEKEGGNIDAAISSIPEGRHVASLIFEQGSKAIIFRTFRHYGALYQATKGGVISRSFAGAPTSAFAFKRGRRPVQPDWGTPANALDPAQDLKAFEYLLVRRGPETLRGEASFDRIYQDKDWRVYRRKSWDASQLDPERVRTRVKSPQ